MIYSAKGLYLDVDVAFERLEEVKKRSPFHRPAHSFMLDYLAPKWHGSREQLMSFARSSVAAAPPGSHVSSLIAEAHDHMAADIGQEEKSAAAAMAYWQSPAVGKEIRQANLRCFQPGAYKLTMDTPRTRVYFAYALWQSGQLEDAAVHLREIGKSTPWGPFQPNIPFFKITVRKARKACGVR